MQVNRRVLEHRGRGYPDVHYLCSAYGIHILGNGYTRHHADVSKESGNGYTLGNNQPKDGHRFGSQCLADAKFVRTFLYGDEHDVAHSHNATQQGKDTYHPNGGTKQVTSRFLLKELFESVSYPDGAPVVGFKLLHFSDGNPIFLFESITFRFRIYVLGEEYQ